MNKKLKNFGCKIIQASNKTVDLLEFFLFPAVLLWTRFYMGQIFWKSGQTKITNLDNAAMLFEWEYIPKWEENSKNVFGLDMSWTVPNPELAATLATYAELGLPVLLIIGLFGRFAAFGLLIMSATIEIFIYPGTDIHYFWMTLLLVLITAGPGKLSLDHLIRKKVFRK